MNISLSEGGHAFPTVNSLVPKELLRVNVEDALSKIFQVEPSKIPFDFIGNTLKPFLGDVDVAISKEFVAKYLGKKEDDKSLYLGLVDLIKSRIPGSDAKAFFGFQQVSFTKELIGSNGKPMPAIDRDSQKLDKSKPGVFQVDLMLGKMGYVDKIMSGAPQDSKYKAVYRNLLMGAIFSNLETSTGKTDPKTKQPLFSRYDYTNKNGLRQMFYTRLPNGKKNVVSDKIITSDPGEIPKLVFNGISSFDAMNSFEKLWALFQGPGFKFADKRQEIIATFMQSLEKNGLPIPETLQNPQ